MMKSGLQMICIGIAFMVSYACNQKPAESQSDQSIKPKEVTAKDILGNATYYVKPSAILKWVTRLQTLKASGKLPKDLWIASSDDFSSWGGGDCSYHEDDLEKLVKAVDCSKVQSHRQTLETSI